MWISKGQVERNRDLLLIVRCAVETGEPMPMHPAASRSLSAERAHISQVLKSAEAYGTEPWERELWSQVRIRMDTRLMRVIIQPTDPLGSGARSQLPTLLSAVDRLRQSKAPREEVQWACEIAHEESTLMAFEAGSEGRWVLMCKSREELGRYVLFTYSAVRRRGALEDSSPEDPSGTSLQGDELDAALDEALGLDKKP